MKKIGVFHVSFLAILHLCFNSQGQDQSQRKSIRIIGSNIITIGNTQSINIKCIGFKLDSGMKLHCELMKFGDKFKIQAQNDSSFFVPMTIPNEKRYIGKQTLLLLDSLEMLGSCEIIIGYQQYHFDPVYANGPIFFNQKTKIVITGKNLISIKEIHGTNWETHDYKYTTKIVETPSITDSLIILWIVLEHSPIKTQPDPDIDHLYFKIVSHKTGKDFDTTDTSEVPFSFPAKKREFPFLTIAPANLVVDDYKSSNMKLKLSFPNNNSFGETKFGVSSEGLLQVDEATFLPDNNSNQLVAWVPINNKVAPGTYYVKVSNANDSKKLIADCQFNIKPTPNVTSIRRLGSTATPGQIPEIDPFDSVFTLVLEGVGLNDRNVSFAVRDNDDERFFKVYQGFQDDNPRILKIAVKYRKNDNFNKGPNALIPAPPFGSYYLYLERQRDTSKICYHSLLASEFKLVEPSKIFPEVSKFVTIENRMTRQDSAKINRKEKSIILLREKISQKVKDEPATDTAKDKRIKRWKKRINRIEKQIREIKAFYEKNVNSPPDLAIHITGDNIPAKYGSQYLKVYAGIYQPEKKTNTELETKTYPDPKLKDNYVVAPSEPEFAKANVRETWESEKCNFFNPDNIAPFNKISLEVAHSPGKYTDKSQSIPLVRNYFIKGNFFDHLGITVTLPPLILLGAITKNEETKKCQVNFQVSTLNVGIGIKYIFRNRHNWLPTGHSTGFYFMGMNFGQVHSDSTQAMVGEKLIGQGTFSIVGFYELTLFSIEKAVKIPVQFGIGFTPVALNNKPLFSAMLGIGINIPIIK